MDKYTDFKTTIKQISEFSLSHTQKIVEMYRKHPKITKWLVITLATLVLLYLCARLWPLYSGEKDILDVLALFIQLLVMVATLYVVRANYGLVKANNTMAKSAEEEISLLKRQFALSKAPILHNVAADCMDHPEDSNEWCIEYENITDNPAMRVTVFGKDNGTYLQSKNTEIIRAKASDVFSMDKVDESAIRQKLAATYARNIEKINDDAGCFAQYFSKDFSGFFVLYQGIDGRLHASCLKGEFIRHDFSFQTEAKELVNRDQSFYPFMQLHEDEAPVL